MFPVDLVFHVSVMFLKFKSAVNWALILHSRICFLENYVPDAVIFLWQNFVWDRDPFSGQLDHWLFMGSKSQIILSPSPSFEIWFENLKVGRAGHLSPKKKKKNVFLIDFFLMIVKWEWNC